MRSTILTVLLLATVIPAAADDVHLTWNASPVAVTGYRLYGSFTSGGPYSLMSSLPPVADCTLTNLAPGLYCYVVTAVNPLESPYSNEACVTIDPPPPPPPPGPVLHISSVTIAVSRKQAYVTWKTDLAADGKVEYGTTPSYGQSASQSGYVTNHSVTLTVKPMRTYYYRITSRTPAGQSATFTGQFYTK